MGGCISVYVGSTENENKKNTVIELLFFKYLALVLFHFLLASLIDSSVASSVYLIATLPRS